MRFSKTIGNTQLKSTLLQMVQGNRLSHALLFSEENGGGAFALALALASLINCKEPSNDDSCGLCGPCHRTDKLIHPDVHFVFPVGKSGLLSENENKAPISDYFLPRFRELAVSNPYFTEQQLYDELDTNDKNVNISVNEAKRINEKLSLKSAEGGYKVMIIYLAEKMNAEAGNKLLKLIEEPPAQTLFILITHAPEKVLQTIRSRCLRVDLKPLSRSERAQLGSGSVVSEFHEAVCAVLKAAVGKSLIDAIDAWEGLSELGREKQKEFCLYFEEFIRKIYMVAGGLESLAFLGEDEEEDIRFYASKLKAEFFEKAFSCIEDTLSAIDSNVNAKLNFCNMCNILLQAA